MPIAALLLTAVLFSEPAPALLQKADVVAVVSVAAGKPPVVTVVNAFKGARVGDRLVIGEWQDAPPVSADRLLVFLARNKATGELKAADGKAGAIAAPSAEVLDALWWHGSFQYSFGYLDPRTEIDRSLKLTIKVKNVGPDAALFDPVRLRGKLFPGRRPVIEKPLGGDATQVAAGENKSVVIDLHEVFGKDLEDQNDYRLEVRGPGPDELAPALELKFNREAVGASTGN